MITVYIVSFYANVLSVLFSERKVENGNLDSFIDCVIFPISNSDWSVHLQHLIKTTYYTAT